MKHLSAVPEQPSAKRSDVPHALDLIVLRALAKDPEDRYETAAEMEADLAQVARGGTVSNETQEAATAVLSGAGLAAAAPTQITPRRAQPPAYKSPGTGFYEYEEPVRRRPVWPWFLALLLLVAAGFAGWYVYTKIQDQLNATKPVSVLDYRGLKEILAVQKIRGAGLTPHVIRRPYDKPSPPVGDVYNQSPDPGTKTDKGNPVTIYVSTGKAKVTVPKVVGDQATDATAALASAKLKWNIVQVHSEQPSGTVTGQSLRAGSRVVEGTVVRINVSKGVAPVQVPSVIGQPVESAISALQGAGFAVGPPVQQDSTEPKGTVIGESPSGNTLQPKGSTITLSVSKGPTTATVPDVTTFDQDTAKQTLKNSGFKVTVSKVDTTDQSQDGVVLSQTPQGNTQASPGATVTINVGKYNAPPPQTQPTQTTTTATTATTTAAPPNPTP